MVLEVVFQHDLQVLGVVRVDAIARRDDEALVDDGTAANAVAKDSMDDAHLPFVGLALGVSIGGEEKEGKQLKQTDKHSFI